MARKTLIVRACIVALAVLMYGGTLRAGVPWVVYKGAEGPGKGKHIVLVSGDEEYRSEEGLPQLGKILATRHGFTCTVLFAIDPHDGTINPRIRDNIPGLQALARADLMIIATRFRDLPDEQMKHIAAYVESGRPIIGMRTATHAFALGGKSSYGKYTWTSKKEWPGGFGRHILGETWVNHWGAHGSQSTRGILAKGAANHPILLGIKDGDVWGPTDVYEVHLGKECTPLVLGQILQGMKSDSPPAEGKKNNPMMPVAWVKTYETDAGKSGRVFTTTMGAATDLVSAGTRRMLVNAAFWAVGMEDKIRPDLNVELVGEFKPSPFKFDGHKKGVKPAEHALK